MNINEIARRAGVSRSTVSYVLSGKRQIGPATKARVMAIIEQSNYRPSASARALSSGTTRTIALAVPRLHHHINTEILQFVGAVAEAAAEREFDTLLSPSGAGDREGAIERLVRERRVDGVVVMETSIPDVRVGFLLDQDFPFVTIGRGGYDDRHDWVDTDYRSLVSEAVHRLVDLGHTHLALVNRPREMLERGYALAVHARDAFVDTCELLEVSGVMVCAEEDDEAGPTCVREMLRLDHRTTGIVSVNDRSLDSLISALAAREIGVPQDVSLIAVAADRVARRTQPAVTAADVPATALATAAVQALLTRIEDPEAPPVRSLFRMPFQERASTGPNRSVGS